MNKTLVLLYGCDVEDLLPDKKNWIRAWKGLLWVSEEDYGYLLSIDELNTLRGCESISIAVKKRRCKWLGYVSLCHSAVLGPWRNAKSWTLKNNVA